MNQLPELFDNNRGWAAGMVARHPRFFNELSRNRHHATCGSAASDSRVPANEIVGLAPGELFRAPQRGESRPAQRLQLPVGAAVRDRRARRRAPDRLRTTVAARVRPRGGAQSSAWWTTGCSRYATSRTCIATSCWRCPANGERRDRLCELNVMVQAPPSMRTTIVQQAWERRQRLTVHAWVYSLQDGLLRDLGFCVSDLASAEADSRAWRG